MSDETRLVAVFDANLAGFTKGMQDAKTQSDKFFDQLQTKMQGAERNITSGFSGIGSSLRKFLSVAAIEEFSRHVITMSAGLIDQAKVLNVNIEQLQTFREVLKGAGGTAEDADTILRRLTSTIGAAQLEGAKGGPAQDIFAHLGLGPDALKGDTVDVLQRVAKALLAISDPAVRARLEIEAFGRSGQEFERVLTQVAAGLGPVADALREQNRLVDDGSARRAKEALDELAASWSKLETAAAGPLSFIIKGFADLIDKAESLNTILKNSDFFQAYSKALDKLGVPNLSASGSFPSSVAVTPQIAGGAGGGGAPFKTQEQIQEETRAAEEAARFMKQLNGELNNFRKSLGENIAQAFTEAQKAARDAISATKDDAAQATDQLSVARNQANVDLLQGTEKAFDAERTLALDETNAQIADIERRKNAQVNALAEEIKNETDFQTARQNVEAAANADIAAVRVKFLSDLAKIEEDQTGKTHDQIQFADQLRTSLTDVGVAASHGFKSFKDAAGQALQTVADLIIQLGIMKPLVNSLLGPQGTTAGGLLGGLGGIGGIISGIGSIFGFAGGGDPPVGVPSIVGERGPELFVPRVPGTIIPNSALGNGGGILQVLLTVQPSGEFDARVMNTSTRAAVSVVTKYDRGLPARVNQIANDPLKR